MARCGCGTDCACVLQGNPSCPSVAVTGAGTPANPFLICVTPTEMPSWHMRGPLTLDESDLYPVIFGGELHVVCQLKVVASADVTIDVFRNGVVIDTITIGIGVSQVVTDTGEEYDPLDTYMLEMTDEGADGEGLVAVGYFTP